MIEVANKFNMVDMGGIDIVESQGVAVEGLFSRLLSAIQNCRYQILYNWKFAQIEIVPSPVELVFDGEKVSINGTITVTEDDVVHVYSLETPIEPVIESLVATENGTYTPPEGVDGYAPVTVSVIGDDWRSLNAYIRSSGIQYIDLEYVVNDQTSEIEVIANVSSNQVKNYAHLIGARTSNASSNACLLAVRDGSTKNIRRAWANSSSGYSVALNARSTFVWESVKARFVHRPGVTFLEPMNGGYGGEFYTMDGTLTTYPLYLFGLNEAGASVDSALCVASVYRVRIMENDIVVHEFVPWQENGVACLKDTVTGNLLYNAGAGDFVYGIDA